MTNSLKTESGLQSLGFKGFLAIKHFCDDDEVFPSVPTEGGIYLVLYVWKELPRFIFPGTGGFFKNKNPNVKLEELQANWVKDARILYIGQSNDLRTRIQQLIDFGHGKNVAHWGGRYLWQIEGSQYLRICWKTVLNHKPEETEMLEAFERTHGDRLPFANLRK